MNQLNIKFKMTICTKLENEKNLFYSPFRRVDLADSPVSSSNSFMPFGCILKYSELPSSLDYQQPQLVKYPG